MDIQNSIIEYYRELCRDADISDGTILFRDVSTLLVLEEDGVVIMPNFTSVLASDLLIKLFSTKVTGLQNNCRRMAFLSCTSDWQFVEYSNPKLFETIDAFIANKD